MGWRLSDRDVWWFMTFETPADLAKAFESGPATPERWLKVVKRHAEPAGFDVASVRAALSSPDHRAVANA